MATVADLFDRLRWYLHEAKAPHQVKKVLRDLESASLASYTGTVGAIDLTSDLTPDVTPIRDPGDTRQTHTRPDGEVFNP